MRTRTVIAVAALAGGVACAETPLLGPGPDMDEDTVAVPLGGIGTGSANVPRGIGVQTAQRAPVGSGELDEDDELLDTDDDLIEDNELPDDGLLADDGGPLEDDGVLGDGPLEDDGVLEDDGLLGDGPLEPDDGLLE